MTKKLSVILASFAMIGYVGCTEFPGFPILPDDGNPGGGGVVDPTDSIPDRDPWGGHNGGDTVIIDGDTVIVDDHGGGRDDCDSIPHDPTDDNGGRRGGRGGKGGRGGHGGGLDDGGGDDNGGDTTLVEG